MLALGSRLRSQKLRTGVGLLAKNVGQRKNIPPCRNITTRAPASDSQRTGSKPYLTVPATLLVLGGLGYIAYENYKPFRHTVLAVVRCSRVAGALARLPIPH